MFGTLFGTFGTFGTSGTFLDSGNNVPEHHRVSLTHDDVDFRPPFMERWSKAICRETKLMEVRNLADINKALADEVRGMTDRGDAYGH